VGSSSKSMGPISYILLLFASLSTLFDGVCAIAFDVFGALHWELFARSLLV